MIKRNHFRIVLLFFITSLFAFLSWDRLQIVFYPQERVPQFVVSCSCVGMSVLDVEQSVTSVLESSIATLSGIKHISSYSYGQRAEVHFEMSTQVEESKVERQMQVLLREVYGSLPKRCGFPVLRQGGRGEAESALQIYNITSNNPEVVDNITTLHRQLVVPISSITGVSKVELVGVPQKRVRISIDPLLLSRYHMQFEQVMEIIHRSSNVSLLDGSGRMVNKKIYLDCSISDLETLRTLPIQCVDGQILRMDEVAVCEEISHHNGSQYRVNGKENIRLLIYCLKDANILEVSRNIEEQVTPFINNKEGDICLSKEKDRTASVKGSLNSLLYRSLISLAILLLLIFISYRRVKYLLVLFAGLVVNFLWSICIISLLDIQIHLYSIAGIAISFGMILDNAIAILDHFKKYENRSNFIAILAASVTTMMAIGLVFLLPLDQQKNLVDFAKIIIVMLSVSLVIAAYFTPAMFYLVGLDREGHCGTVGHGLLTKSRYKLYKNTIQWLANRKKIVWIFMILLFGLPLFLMPRKLDDGPLKLYYNTTFGSNFYNYKMRPIVNKVLGGVSYVFYTNVYESEIKIEEPEFCLRLTASLMDGYTSIQLVKLVDLLETEIAKYDGYNRFETSIGVNLQANIEVYYPRDNFDEAAGLKRALMLIALKRDGASWNISGYGKPFTSGQKICRRKHEILLKGFPYESLAYWARRIGDSLKTSGRVLELNCNDRINDFDLLKTEFVAFLDRKKLYHYGISSYQWQQLIQSNNRADYPNGQVVLGGRRVPIITGMEENELMSFEQIEAGYLYDMKGESRKLALSKI
ncbi:efflux RND transporter permease subunit [Halosquirtibacter xylanolyticus]|uniref:efflux RND transporter permease subunit n=1 Tax=Halosquirtibacter xylanolyticus TaxID=3374599 RepID=UPI0037488097|nr:efflux RND transporter permease subunit [Prolixibacteraceae bacterium]